MGVNVRIVDINADAGLFVLSMKGTEADMKADLERQYNLLSQQYSGTGLQGHQNEQVSPSAVRPAESRQVTNDLRKHNIGVPLPDKQDLSPLAGLTHGTRLE